MHVIAICGPTLHLFHPPPPDLRKYHQWYDRGVLSSSSRWWQGRKTANFVTQSLQTFCFFPFISARLRKTREMKQYENLFSEGKLLFGWAAHTVHYVHSTPRVYEQTLATVPKKKKKKADVEENELRCVCRHLCVWSSWGNYKTMTKSAIFIESNE